MKTNTLKSIIFILIFSFFTMPIFSAANDKKKDIKSANAKVQANKKSAQSPQKSNKTAAKPAPKKVSAPVSENIVMERIYTGVGEEIRVDLEANPTAGYTWVVKDPKKLNILELVDEQYSESKRAELAEINPLGASGIQIFTFKVIKSGVDILRFEHARPLEKGQEKNAPSYKAYEVIAE
ncbi:MAG: protease inhibitor I42 family protein [Elusimicrobiota bacterium]|jgi:predicted secreted protein|nr:protease inhibitor I42 family protein [Elusimicrobiota bacterium]